MFVKKDLKNNFKSKKLKNRERKKNKFIQFSNNSIANFLSYTGILLLIILLVIIFLKINIPQIKIYNNNYINTSSKIISEKKHLTLLEKNKIKLEKIKQDNKRKKEEREKKIKENKLRNEKKINFLLVGRGGHGNDAPQLTDSIILLSYYKEKNHISMLSIPRDLYVDYGLYKNGKKLKGKINALYVMNLEQTHSIEKSIKKLEEKIEEITNEKIDYYINIDFRGFTKLIDSIGGVNVNVPRTLVDNNYPDNNHGVETFVVKKGKWILDGRTALKYVRSRKNTGGDFGRSKRQQQIIKSLKEKILSSNYLTSPSKIKKLYSLFNKYISTDIGIWDFIKIATSIKTQDNLKFYSTGLNTSCIKKNECTKGGLLFYPQRIYFGGQSVLLSGNSTYLDLGNYNEIHVFSDIIFNYPELFGDKTQITIFSKKSDMEKANILKEKLIIFGLYIKNYELIGIIPEKFHNINGGLGNIQNISKNTGKNTKNKISLYKYNKLLKEEQIDFYNLKNNSRTNPKIGIEANNQRTKLIINNIDINNKSVLFLKKVLKLNNSDIIINYGGPKYSKNKKTKIEIIFKN